MTKFSRPSTKASGSYLAVLGVGVLASQFANYIWYEVPVVKGQAANVLVTFLFFSIALILWFVDSKRSLAIVPLRWFLGAMAFAWAIQIALYRHFGDSFNYTALLYVPMLAMVLLKMPSVGAARRAVLSMAWMASAMLILTLVLEVSGIWTAKVQSNFVIGFDESNYFLPVNQFLGIDGRWPGPFGHNGDTAMIGALLIVVAIAFWSKSSWLFLAVGFITLLVTSGRASIGAAAFALVLLAMFTQRGPFAGIPRPWRIGGGSLILLFGAIFLFAGKSGLTGRQNIWPAFIELWQSSPILGVGGSGIAVSGGLTQQFGHAHSLYLDELARHGIVGFVSQFLALAIGVGIAILAARLGAAGPLAVLAFYFVAGVTEPRNGWISPTVTGFLVTVMVVFAAAELKSRSEAPKSIF